MGASNEDGTGMEQTQKGPFDWMSYTAQKPIDNEDHLQQQHTGDLAGL